MIMNVMSKAKQIETRTIVTTRFLEKRFLYPQS